MDPAFQSILTGAQAGAEWAWRRLYDEHAPRVLQYLRAQRAADPDGVLGEVFVRVVRGLPRFEGDEDAFRGWLFRIAQNCLIDAARSTGPEQLHESPPVREHAPDAAAEVDAALREQRAYRLLSVLPEDQRAVVFMRLVLDMSVADVATVLDRRDSAVKMLYQRALKTLRERNVQWLEH